DSAQCSCILTMRIDNEDVGCFPSALHDVLKYRSDGARLSRTRRSHDRRMPYHEPRRVQSDWNIFSRRQPSQAQVLLIWSRKDRFELLRSREVDGIVKPWVGTHTPF